MIKELYIGNSLLPRMLILVQTASNRKAYAYIFHFLIQVQTSSKTQTHKQFLLHNQGGYKKIKGMPENIYAPCSQILLALAPLLPETPIRALITFDFSTIILQVWEILLIGLQPKFCQIHCFFIQHFMFFVDSA